MLTAEENDLLTLVEGDAPMGRLMRRHWTPVCLVEEVAEPDGTPLPVEALGQRMVAFRDSKGRLGLLDEKCPHRGASLLLGRNEECGLRCLYHGWKYAVDGQCVAMSSEPEGSMLMEKVRARAYPVVEWGGFVWAWLGEREAAPPFDPPAFAPRDDIDIAILKIRVPCNWAQIHEGQIDSAHSSSLHSSDMVPARGDARLGRRQVLVQTVDRQIAAHADRAHQLRLPLRRDPAAGEERGDPQLSARHRIRRALLFADPAERPAPRRQRYRAGRRREQRLLLHRLGRARTCRRRRNGEPSTARAAAST